MQVGTDRKTEAGDGRKYAVIVGTRPEAIKLLPLVAELERDARVYLISTGQHRGILNDVFTAFGREPDADLSLLREGETTAELLASLLVALPPVLTACAPDAVIVQGDTASTFGGALCGFLAGLPVLHVEAGMRTYDLSSPFPEEYFRRAVSTLAALHFAPTDYELKNLVREGVPERRVFVTGNTVTDALARFCPSEAAEDETVLLTCHRRENATRVAGYAATFDTLAARHPRLRFVFVTHPAHPAPPLKHAALSPPLPLPEFYRLLAGARLVLTDSGGLEEEAAALGIPTLVLRDRTERVAQAASGRIEVVGTDPDRAARRAEELLTAEKRKRAMPTHSPSRRIAEILRHQNILL